MEVQNKTFTATIKAAPAGSVYDATFVMSASAPDRVNDTIDEKAYSATLGKSLPALLGHDHSKIIGAWENLRVEGGKLIGDLRTAGTGLGKMVKQLLLDSIPVMASIGFSGKGKQNDKGGIHFSSLDIHECSVVAVGCHTQATRVKALEIARAFDCEEDFSSSLSVDDDEEKAASGRNLDEILQKSRAAILAANKTLRMKGSLP